MDEDLRITALQDRVRRALRPRSPAQRLELLAGWAASAEFASGGTLLWRASGGPARDILRDRRTPQEELVARGFEASELAFAQQHRLAILLPLLGEAAQGLIATQRQETAQALADTRWRLRQAEERCQRRWRRLKRLAQRRRVARAALAPRPWSRLDWLYLTLLALATLFVGALVWIGSAQQPSVSIEFNVGEILGGLLAGAGILVAGGAYAAKTLREAPPPDGPR